MVSRGLSRRPGIYAIVHLASGRFYIGSGVDLWERCKTHKRDLRYNRHHSPYLQNAWRKHGFSAFVFMPLEIVPRKEDLVRIEQEYLDRLTPYDPAIGFNISPTAGSMLGVKRPPEFGAASSARQKGKTLTPEHRAALSAAKMGVKRGPHSPEHRAKIAAANKGRKFTAEQRARMSEAKRNLPAEVKAKVYSAVSAALKGKKLSAEHRAKIGAASRRYSAERRAGKDAASGQGMFAFSD